MVNVNIRFIDSVRTFTPGSIVAGVVLVDFNPPTKITKITIKLIGKASTCFSFADERQITRTYAGKQEYIDNEKILWHSHPENADTETIPRELPFSFLLPENCPPSFQSNSAKISYKLVANVDIPWAMDSDTVEEIEVTSNPIDLKWQPLLGQVKRQTKEHMDLKVIVSPPFTRMRQQICAPRLYK